MNKYKVIFFMESMMGKDKKIIRTVLAKDENNAVLYAYKDLMKIENSVYYAKSVSIKPIKI